MKKNITYMLFITAFTIASALSANGGRLPAGTEAVSMAQRTRLAEKRAAFAAKIKKGVDLTEEEEALIREEELLKSRDKRDVAIYFSSHQGAYHHPSSISAFGDTVELEDGSIWNVYLHDRRKVLDWMTGDTILIVPNSDWFSSYNYRLINVNSGAQARVNLAFGSIINGIYSHWIIAIDLFNGEICLEDGSLWQMFSWDKQIIKEWQPGDIVIIGHNNGIFKYINPNILINVRKDNYAAGNCVH